MGGSIVDIIKVSGKGMMLEITNAYQALIFKIKEAAIPFHTAASLKA